MSSVNESSAVCGRVSAPWDSTQTSVCFSIHYTVGCLSTIAPGFRPGLLTLQVLLGYFSLFLMSDLKEALPGICSCTC